MLQMKRMIMKFWKKLKFRRIQKCKLYQKKNGTRKINIKLKDNILEIYI